MPYPQRLLNDFEEVAVDLHPHWWHYAKPAAAVVAAIALGVVALTATDPGSTVRAILGWVALAALVVSVLWLVKAYAQWSTTNFVVTSDRLIFRTGVLGKSGVEIPLERVNNVHFRQSLFERIVGAGDLLIESGGEDGQQRFTDIRRPDRVQKEIHLQMEANERRRFGGGSTSTPGTDVVTQLEKLEGLYERGSITREEFEAHKARLLRDL